MVAGGCDLGTNITNGVSGNILLLHCPCEQVQLTVLNLIVLYCAACPGKVVLCSLTTNALRFWDPAFYLMIWDGEDDQQDDNILDKDGGLLIVQDP